MTTTQFDQSSIIDRLIKAIGNVIDWHIAYIFEKDLHRRNFYKDMYRIMEARLRDITKEEEYDKLIRLSQVGS
jgi:hypothetical protein